jgi:hypothetical protein
MIRPAASISPRIHAVAVTFLLAALVPRAAWAQTEAGGARWSVVPLVGFGALIQNGGWGSAGMEGALEVEYGGSAWRSGGFASLRGIGVGCSEACFDGGPAVAASLSRSVGTVRLGGGVGVMKQLQRWAWVPLARVSVDAAPMRWELRVEWPRHRGAGVYVPLLAGVPVPRR